MNKEHKYKDKDEYKDNDKDKDASRITESLTVCYIFEILMCRPVQSSSAQYSPLPPNTAQYSPVLPSTAQYIPVQPSTAQRSRVAAQCIPLQPAILVNVVGPVTLSSLSETA